MITLLKAAFVIGFADGDHVIWRQGEVAFEGKTIVFVGRGFSGTPDKVIEAGHAIVSPGFIDLDALADIDHALIDSWHGPETAPGLQWSEDYFHNRRRDVFSPEDRDFKREFAFSQLIRNGITTAMPIAAETHNEWAETYDETAAAADIAARLGLRIYLGPAYRSGVNVTRSDGSRDVLFNEELGRRNFDEAVRFARDFASRHDGLVRGCLLPCRIETQTPEILRKTAEAQQELGCLVRLHSMQSEAEIALIDKWHAKTPLELIEGAGLLGPYLSMPHGLYLGGVAGSGRSVDAERLAAAGTTIIHCPMTLLRYGSAMESFDRFRQAGVNIALGTDSFPPDMIRNMDIGSSLMKWIDGRLDAGAAADYFRAATLGGARALGRDDLGRLEPGAKADMIVVDLTDPRIGPIDDPIRTLLMNCTGANIRDVIINGRVVMKDRTLASIDEATMRDRSQAYFDKMKAAYSDRDYLGRDAGELFRNSLDEPILQRQR